MLKNKDRRLTKNEIIEHVKIDKKTTIERFRKSFGSYIQNLYAYDLASYEFITQTYKYMDSDNSKILEKILNIIKSESNDVYTKNEADPYALSKNEDFVLKDIPTSQNKRMGYARIGQSDIRKYVLENYSDQCAMCDIDDPQLLIAGHIIPWSEDESKRGNLENVICLCIIHHELFDQGKIRVDENYRIQFSQKFIKSCNKCISLSAIRAFTNDSIRMPKNKTIVPSKDLFSIHNKQFQYLESLS